MLNKEYWGILMAKAQSPVRLEASLMESAALAGEAFKRSAAEQVEFWASIGRIVSARITPNEIMELQAGLTRIKLEKSDDVIIDPKGLLAEIDQKRQSGALQKSITNNDGSGRVCYQASSKKPGYLEQVAPDGTVTIGLFQDGQFKAIP